MSDSLAFVTGSHEFQINEYNITKGISNKNYLQSTSFKVGGHDWVIEFYPNGFNSDVSNYISVAVRLVSPAKEVKAIYTLRFRDWKTTKWSTKTDISSDVRSFKPNSAEGRWRWSRFIKRSAFEESDYLKDNKLIIKCRLWVVIDNSPQKPPTPKKPAESKPKEEQQVPKPVSPAPQKAVIPDKQPSNFVDEFTQLLETGDCADVTFLVEGKTFAAHKCVLVARSSVFREQLAACNVKSTQRISIDQIDALTFKYLLHFIYTDSLPYSSTSVEVTQRLLIAAHQFKIDRLKLICEKELPDNVAITMINTLELTVHHNRSLLKVVETEYTTKSEKSSTISTTKETEYIHMTSQSVREESNIVSKAAK